jgi:hypothetical protein
VPKHGGRLVVSSKPIGILKPVWSTFARGQDVYLSKMECTERTYGEFSHCFQFDTSTHIGMNTRFSCLSRSCRHLSCCRRREGGVLRGWEMLQVQEDWNLGE